MIMTIIRLKRQEIIYHVVIYLASFINQPSEILNIFISGVLSLACIRQIRTFSEPMMGYT